MPVIDICTLLLTVIVTGQEPPLVQRMNPPGARITHVGWRTPPAETPSQGPANPGSVYSAEAVYPGRAEDAPNRRPLGLPERGIPPLPRLAPRRTGGKASLIVGLENKGAKVITAVWWKAAFIETASGSEHHVLRFRTEAGIRPGGHVTFDKKFAFDKGWKRFLKNVEQKGARMMIWVEGLEYADGSSWQPRRR